jgi:hypothetical protein
MIYILLEEDMLGAKVLFASPDRKLVEEQLKKEFNADLRYLADGLWRCGSSVVSIQEVELSN